MAWRAVGGGGRESVLPQAFGQFLRVLKRSEWIGKTGVYRPYIASDALDDA